MARIITWNMAGPRAPNGVKLGIVCAALLQVESKSASGPGPLPGPRGRTRSHGWPRKAPQAALRQLAHRVQRPNPVWLPVSSSGGRQMTATDHRPCASRTAGLCELFAAAALLGAALLVSPPARAQGVAAAAEVAFPHGRRAMAGGVPLAAYAQLK